MAFGEDKRREVRQTVSLPATLRHYREQADVRVLDISSGGAMLSADAPPARGEEVLLIRGTLEVVATIAWVQEQHCGLCFHRQIDKRTLLDASIAA